ncbi:hypothetical protein Tco_1042597 [Tanacetum coccineum]|uniref:Uncharacterized protein n=1 Tax=Tanacetum coccineum TaxID=301880 RepID=A0ABQ5GJL5_9ASTR
MLVAKPTTLGDAFSLDHVTEARLEDQEVVQKIKLPIITTNPFKVYIGSGETLLCENLCSRVKFDIQWLSMEVDLYVLPTKVPDAMLRIQWNQKLGKVTHDYLQQTMELILGETWYTLQRAESLRMKRIRLHHMRALLETKVVFGVYELYNYASHGDEQEHT